MFRLLVGCTLLAVVSSRAVTPIEDVWEERQHTATNLVGYESDFPESFEVVDMAHAMHASRYSDPHGYKLAQGSKVAYGRSQAVKKGAEKLAQGLARMLAGKADAQLEKVTITAEKSAKKAKTATSSAKKEGANKGGQIVEYGGSTSCRATRATNVATVALEKGGDWTYFGGWKNPSKTARTLKVHFIYLRLSSPQNKCKGNPSGVCMDRRIKDNYGTAAAQDAALKNPPAHKGTKPRQCSKGMQQNIRLQREGGCASVLDFPKRIGSEGECFVKCKHVVWNIMPERTQENQNWREHYSCKFAQVLGCKTDGGKTGYIDVCKGSGCKTNKWRTCTCQSKLSKDGSCPEKKVVNDKPVSWKVQ